MKISQQIKDSIYSAYKRGEKKITIRNTFGISLYECNKVLNEYNVPKLEKRKKVVNPLHIAIANDFANGLVSVKLLAEKYNVCKTIIYNSLHQCGLRSTRLSKKDKILELKKNGTRICDIAKKLNITTQYVHLVLRESRKIKHSDTLAQ